METNEIIKKKLGRLYGELQHITYLVCFKKKKLTLLELQCLSVYVKGIINDVK